MTKNIFGSVSCSLACCLSQSRRQWHPPEAEHALRCLQQGYAPASEAYVAVFVDSSMNSMSPHSSLPTIDEECCTQRGYTYLPCTLLFSVVVVCSNVTLLLSFRCLDSGFTLLDDGSGDKGKERRHPPVTASTPHSCVAWAVILQVPS